ncbi:hypothetical protein RHSIM_Rhsim03G0021500 [Rhododendron simsii]|uniref:Uncharacterized protein n=1 Tax=Rhododendron simsii TaxID=118357 RepID=A0A834H6J4_RHOSS|nr:hypothetical protein RHSIM_Rhsim03G0021500 [Rhododendron simsii]
MLSDSTVTLSVLFYQSFIHDRQIEAVEALIQDLPKFRLKEVPPDCSKCPISLEEFHVLTCISKHATARMENEANRYERVILAAESDAGEDDGREESEGEEGDEVAEKEFSPSGGVGVDLGEERVGQETVDEYREVERPDQEVSEVEGFGELELWWLIHGGWRERERLVAMSEA